MSYPDELEKPSIVSKAVDGFFISFHHRLIHQRPQLGGVIDIARREKLREIHHNQLLTRIDPVGRMIRPSPTELSNVSR